MNTQNSLSGVLEKICEIAEKTTDVDYIFRGEPKHYPKVASSLYREYQYDIEADDFDIEFVQKEILNEAKKYVHTADEFEILIKLFAYGDKINLIDFTTDFHIALFFACDSSPTEDGRVILKKRDSVAGYLKKPREPIHSFIAQKGVCVCPPKGFINPDKVITIPAALKLPMLEHLRKSHGISTETVYNDLHGFMINRSVHEGAYTQFYKGQTCQKRGDAGQTWDEKLMWYERAVLHYTEALELKPNFPEGYNRRGTVYVEAGDFDRAIQDYNTALKLKPDYASAYNNRGIAYYSKGDCDKATQDYRKAIELESDYASAYNNLGIAYSKQGEYERAIHYYNKVIKLKPDFSEGYNNRGIAYYSKGDFGKAIQDFDMAIELKPDWAKVYSNLGVAYLRKGEVNRAIQNHNRAIKLEPGFAGFYSNRGAAWLHLKEWEKAKFDLTVARNEGLDIIASFHNDYESVADFEKKNNVQLPKDIRAMLTQK